MVFFPDNTGVNYLELGSTHENIVNPFSFGTSPGPKIKRVNNFGGIYKIAAQYFNARIARSHVKISDYNSRNA